MNAIILLSLHIPSITRPLIVVFQARRGGVVTADSAVRITSKGGQLVLEPTRSPQRGNSPAPPASTSSAAVLKLLSQK